MDDLTRRSVLSAGVAAVWAWPRGEGAVPLHGARFQLAAVPAADEQPCFVSTFIDHDPPVPYVHCPSLCELPDGGLACAWYAGSYETARDVGVWLATAPAIAGDAAEPIAWATPRVVIDRPSATTQLDRFIDKIGNAVVFTDETGRLWLVYVTIAIGGWSGSSLNACSSTDGGATWTTSRRLATSPFFNVSELVRAAPVRLDSGEILLPVYHECVGKFPELLWLRPESNALRVRKTRLAGGRSLLQPAVVPLDGQRCLAFLRDHSPARRLVVQRSLDTGRTWSPPAPTPLPNPDASVAAVRLSDGTVLVACNLARQGRATLDLVQFDPAADAWHRLATLDDEPGALFAYPYMAQDRRGRVHLVYTWKMRRVRHVVMNEAWLRAQGREPVA
jgi:predicted neuraminidase